jgi:hypothetical protein
MSLHNHWKLPFIEWIWQGNLKEIEWGSKKKISKGEKRIKRNNKAKSFLEWDDKSQTVVNNGGKARFLDLLRVVLEFFPTINFSIILWLFFFSCWEVKERSSSCQWRGEKEVKQVWVTFKKLRFNLCFWWDPHKKRFMSN